MPTAGASPTADGSPSGSPDGSSSDDVYFPADTTAELRSGEVDRMDLADGPLKATGAVAAGRPLLAKQRVRQAGLYAPHSVSGTSTLVVDGVHMSDFTAAVHPAVARAFLAPLTAR